MNNFTVMAEIVGEPQLRYTSDNQIPVTETMVQFPGLREDDRPSVVKLVAWQALAQDLQEQYRVGDRIIIEGRLGMINVDRAEGFKEKRAELTASRIHKVGIVGSSKPTAPAATASVAPPTQAKAPKPRGQAKQPAAVGASTASAPVTAASDIDYDDIPFAVNPGHDDMIDSAIHRPIVGMEFRKL